MGLLRAVQVLTATAAVALLVMMMAGCAGSTQGSVAVASAPATSSEAVLTFGSDVAWRKNLEVVVPLTETWADDYVVPIAKAFCNDWNKLPRVTTSDIDHSMDVLMNGGPSKMNRNEAWAFLTNTVAQFCPAYNSALAQYK